MQEGEEGEFSQNYLFPLLPPMLHRILKYLYTTA
jgi:hypothetical protein